jgi:hypothetical protein
VHKISNISTFDVAATMPLQHVITYHSLVQMMCMIRSKNLLIHEALEPVGEAKISLTFAPSAKISFTVRSDDKKIYLAANFGIDED